MASGAARPRVLFVSGTTYELPLSPSLAKKWDALEERMDVRVVGRGPGNGVDPRFRLLPMESRPSAALSRLRLPFATLAEARRLRPDVVIAQGPFDAVPLLVALRGLRPPPKLVVELHGDWRTATRAYGPSRRRVYAGLADRAAELALRRADGTRAVSDFTASLAESATGRSPLASFPAYMDLEAFTREPLRPLPVRPTVAWVGALQRVKDPATLARAWRLIAEGVPEANLVMVGDGPLRDVADQLARELPARVQAIRSLPSGEVSRVLDESTVLALPSVSEGLPRVAIEAFARGRPVVGSDAGGIPDIVKPERNGLLVPPGDSKRLADALTRVLSDRSLAERLARGAAEDAERYAWAPARYADAVRELVDTAIHLPP